MKKALMEFLDGQYIYCKDHIANRNLEQALRSYYMAEGAMFFYQEMFWEQNGCNDAEIIDLWFDNTETAFYDLIYGLKKDLGII